MSIVEICEAICRGEASIDRTRRARTAHVHTSRTRAKHAHSETCRCGRPAPRGKTCGDEACQRDHFRRWQNERRAIARREREAAGHPVRFGPKPWGETLNASPQEDGRG